jgi:D-arabinose 1-dehydrogenase-like Zn-dependent alcohol dehydrogenase
MESETYEHPSYKYQSDRSKADEVAWVFVDPNNFIEFPFNFPPLGPTEIRANVLYAGLCPSDSFRGRSKWGPAKYPFSPGHKNICEVSQVGSEFFKFRVGDKVVFGTFREVCG